MSTNFSIKEIKGRRVWDSRGRPTVETEVLLENGGFGVDGAVANVNGEIAKLLKGKDAQDQVSIDHGIIDLDGTENRGRLGGNAMIATSTAVAHAAADGNGKPLWVYLRDKETTLGQTG